MKTGIQIESVRKVVDDGNHNAFTDLCRFRDRIYLTHRRCPDGHMVFDTSQIVVHESADEGATWSEVNAFGVPTRDVRDPHFLVFGDRLFVYTGAWLVEERRDMNHHLGYCAWTVDGRQWSEPTFLEGTYGHYIWRAAAHGDTAFLCARRKREFVRTEDSGDAAQVCESALMASPDGLVWSPVGFFQTEYGDETAFLFEEDGGVLAVARTGGNRPAQICRSKPPYREWTRTDLHRHVGGPLLARWGDRYLVGGRKSVENRGAMTALGWLVGDELVDVAELPSGGDTSYPGFIPLSDTEGLLSYYSSHEGSGSGAAPSAIYVARLRIG